MLAHMLRKGYTPVIYTLSKALVVTTSFILGCLPILAQQAAGFYADENHPSGAPDPSKVDDIWHVDNITGALRVTVPFPTVPAGGRGPHIPFALLYNSSSTVTFQRTRTISTGDATTQYFQWMPGSYAAPTGPIGPWTTTGPFLVSNGTFIDDYTPVYGNGIHGTTVPGCQISGPHLYTDEHGATHDLNVLYNANGAGNSTCTETYNESTSVGATTDGSGMKTALDGRLGATGTATVVYPNGTQFSYGSQGDRLEDANGNFVSISQDSLGRAPFTISPRMMGLIGSIPSGDYSITVKDAAGHDQSYVVTVSSVPVGVYTMPHPLSGEISNQNTTGTISVSIAAMTASTTQAVTSIRLPNATSYIFEYNPTYGTLNKITFPTGGVVTFSWGIRGDCGGYGDYTSVSCVVVTDAFVADGTNTNHWSYNFPDYVPRSFQLTSTVTAPDGSYTKYTGGGTGYSGLPFFIYNSRSSVQEYQRLVYKQDGTLMESVETSYGGSIPGPYDYAGPVGDHTQAPSYSLKNPLPSLVTTTLYDGASPLQKTIKLGLDPYGNTFEKDESDWYACSGTPCPVTNPPNGWLRKTFTNYVWSNPNSGQPSYNYLEAHIVDKPSQVTITDGASNPLSMVQYNYDEYTLSGNTGIIINHDDVNYPASKVGPRGNLTSERRCLYFAGGTCSTWNPTTTYKYDLAGMLQSMTDPNGHTTSFDYTDSYQSFSPSGVTDAFVTTVTKPSTNGVQHIEHATYYQTGSPASRTDENGALTRYLYDDPLNRLSATVLPPTIDGSSPSGQIGNGGTSIAHTDSPNAGWSVRRSVARTIGGAAVTSVDTLDGLGRLASSFLADASGGVYITRDYDSMGRLWHVSNSFRTTSDVTYGTTTYGYDPIGRMTSKSNADPSNEHWFYSGNSVTFRDGRTHDWQRTSDGLGRLIAVSEPNGVRTDYVHDGIGDLLTVTQSGATGETARMRTFTYDGLARLTCSANPETSNATVTQGVCPSSGSVPLPSGVVGYAYDGKGNITAKTDTRGITVTYVYDELDRLTARGYPNDSSTPSSCYLYDVNGIATLTNATGRLTAEWSQKGVCPKNATSVPSSGLLSAKVVTAYDAEGRIRSEKTCVLAKCDRQLYSNQDLGYDLAGNVTNFGDGWGLQTFSQSYDLAGRLDSLTSSWVDSVHPALLYGVQTFGPVGVLDGVMGNHLRFSSTYDKRERITGTDVKEVQ